MSDDIREKILNAAENRFRTYGYGKTTMAEIAGDIEMSTANLYRYFENKLSIGSAMAGRCFCEREIFLTEIVNREGLNEVERLETFVLEMLNFMHGQFSNEPRMAELVEVIITKCPDLIQEKVTKDKQLIAMILKQGCDSGEFSVADVEEMSGFVRASVAQFVTPFFMTMYPLEELEPLAKGVVSLILNGLSKNK
ncbi:MAG: TetR/AcrR family transcriptional regulator [Woeseiaceae bacterium]